jgi:hypothetical protein
MRSSKSEVSPEILRLVSTSDTVESRLGLLEFATARTVTFAARPEEAFAFQPFFDKSWRPSEIEPI